MSHFGRVAHTRTLSNNRNRNRSYSELLINGSTVVGEIPYRPTSMPLHEKRKTVNCKERAPKTPEKKAEVIAPKVTREEVRWEGAMARTHGNESWFLQ